MGVTLNLAFHLTGRPGPPRICSSDTEFSRVGSSSKIQKLGDRSCNAGITDTFEYILFLFRSLLTKNVHSLLASYQPILAAPFASIM